MASLLVFMATALAFYVASSPPLLILPFAFSVLGALLPPFRKRALRLVVAVCVSLFVPLTLASALNYWLWGYAIARPKVDERILDGTVLSLTEFRFSNANGTLSAGHVSDFASEVSADDHEGD